MIYRDWRGHGATCPCERCAAWRRHDDLTTLILVVVGTLALLGWALHRWV